MTDNTQPLRLANILRGIDARSLFANEKLSAASAALENQHARITELESQLAQRFDAADMATASAQGFRDGVASLTAQAAESAIENCPELNMGNYDEVDVERLNDWAIRANVEIDRLHALAAGQAAAAQAVAEPADTVVLNAAMRAIQQAIELIGAPTDERMRAVRRVLRGAVIVAEDAGKVAPLPGTAYAALPESFLEIPDVQDESGINAYYSREVVLECIDAALASHGQAPAEVSPTSGAADLPEPHFGEGRHLGLAFRSDAYSVAQVQALFASHGQAPATPQADGQPALDRTRIREIFMTHGFTVKEGQTDLKQYVYDAADALLRAASAPADSVLEDAARYRYLRDGDWREHEKLESVIRLQLNALWDETIDAARKQGGA